MSDNTGQFKNGAISLKKDMELFEYLLENAELEFEQGSNNGITPHFELENGLKIHFGDGGEFIKFELP